VNIVAIDQAVRAWIVGHRVAALNPLFEALSLVGTGGFIWYVAALTLLASKQIRPRAFARFVLTILLTWLIVERVLKLVVSRERPFMQSPEISVLGVRSNDFSFPSGHAAVSFAAAFVLSRFVPRARVAWWTLALAIAFSRIYVGVHFPLDVIAGALVGVTCGVVAMRGQATHSSRP